MTKSQLARPSGRTYNVYVQGCTLYIKTVGVCMCLPVSKESPSVL